MLQLAVSSDDVGLVNVLDAHSFARLLPLLGEQLNEAKVEQLFEAVALPAGRAKRRLGSATPWPPGADLQAPACARSLRCALGHSGRATGPQMGQ